MSESVKTLQPGDEAMVLCDITDSTLDEHGQARTCHFTEGQVVTLGRLQMVEVVGCEKQVPFIEVIAIDICGVSCYADIALSDLAPVR